MSNAEDVPRHGISSIFGRDYVLGFLVFLAFLLGFHALVPTLPLYLAGLGSNAGEIGALVGTIGVSSLISRLLVGRILLRYSEKLVMMCGSILFALTFLALIVFRPFWPFFFIRVLQGIAFAGLDTSAIAYIIRIIPPAHRTRAISYFLLGPSFASAMAASSSVAVVNAYNFTVLLFGCTGLSLCAFFLSCKLREWKTTETVVVSPLAKTLFFQRKIIAPSMMSFLFAFSWGAVMAFFPLYAVHCGVANPGYFFTANAVTVIMSRLLGGRILDILSKEKIIPIFIFVSMTALVILSFSKTLPMFILVGFIWGMGNAFIYPACMAYALEYAGTSDGASVGTFQAFLDLGMALGPITMGIILPHTGYQMLFLCLAFTCFMNLSYFQFYLRKKGRAVHMLKVQRDI